MGIPDGRKQFGHSPDLPLVNVASTKLSKSLTASQSKETFSLFVIPHLNLVVITTGTEDRLSGMEADTSNRA